MKAILISSPPNFELVDIPAPRCSSDYVIVRTDSCGVCGTDVEILRGSMANGFVRYPLVPGHEWTGMVEDFGRTCGMWPSETESRSRAASVAAFVLTATRVTCAYVNRMSKSALHTMVALPNLLLRPLACAIAFLITCRWKKP
jgi:D-arabinose 1-dehydrogenase-like Zn-dependent alcohol dehydrogenase